MYIMSGKLTHGERRAVTQPTKKHFIEKVRIDLEPARGAHLLHDLNLGLLESLLSTFSVTS